MELEHAYITANELSSERRYDEAIQILDQVLSGNPADVNALIRKGALLHTAGRYSQAKDTLLEALCLDPQNLGALQTLAYVENALGEPERSLSLFRELASLKGPDENLTRMIGDLMRAVDEKRINELSSEHRYDEAIQILDRALSANPADVNALIRKGALLHTAGRYPQAKAPLLEALRLDPQNIGALQTLAHVENALGEPERSLSLFRQLASLKGPDEDLGRMIQSLMWAVADKRVNELSSERRYDEAIQILDRILSAEPADVNALIRKGALLHTAGRYPQAKAPLVEALGLDPENIGALQTLAHVESALGEPERSLPLFRQLASLKGLDEELARMIGNQMWALDEKRRHSIVYQDFEEGCPPIEQVIAEIDGGAIGGAGSIEQLSRQIAAQTAVLGRIRSWQESHDYFLIQHRFRNMALHSYRGARFKPPEDPTPEIPETLRDAFSMHGRVELLQGYINSAVPPECTEGIDDDALRTFLALNYESLPPEAKPGAARMIKDFVPSQHPQTTKAFARGSIPLPPVALGDKSVAVVASHDYYLDATLICLSREVTSVRLRHINGSTELFRTTFLFDWLREDTQYDLIICPVLLESWGLGRHGEPLDPDADIALMRRFREKLRPGGSCYIQLPVGRDRLIFNAMRIYGTHRLAAILEGWRPKSADGVKPDRLTARVPVRENFVLQPNGHSSRRSSTAREPDEHPSGARVMSMDASSAGGAAASLQPLMQKLRAEALAQAEQIAALRAQLESMHMDFPALTVAEYQLNHQTFGPPNPCPPPPREIPSDLLDAFTMGGVASVEFSYLDGTYPGKWPLIYTDNEIDYYLKRIGERKWFLYGTVDAWIWEAITKYPIAGLSVVNMGSLTPWYESNCLYYGASSTTIDYNKIITLSDRIKTMTVADWDREQPTFDVAWSISSFEHDGLGMYGDPLDPDGDLKAMRKMKRIVKPGGLMFFAVPVAKEDKILYNLCRIYGEVRLKKMFEGWEVLDTYGLHPPGAHVQPLFILRNV